MRALVVLLLVGVLGGGGELDRAAGLRSPRAVHTATALPDGRVLVAGGCVDPGCETATATTEFYAPAKRRFVPGPRLSRPRVGHAAVKLRDGSVLVLGGWSGRTPSATAERLMGGRFLPTGAMASPRGGFTATRLRDGRVFVVGGTDGSRTLATAELYDPTSGRFTSSGNLGQARSAHTATLLGDGRVLVVGGSDGGSVLATAEVFDPARGRFEPAGSLRAPRHKHAAVALRDGRVLVVGGSDARDFRGRYRASELWSPTGRRFTQAPALRERRFKLPDAVVRLAAGDVLVAGGGGTVERYRPGGQFLRDGELGRPFMFATATVLPDGRVLVAGGYDQSITPTAGAWLYQP
jgi:Galactose oxidase, central domain/Kelch motif